VGDQMAEERRWDQVARRGARDDGTRRRLTGASPEKVSRALRSTDRAGFGAGGRGERGEAHQGLVDGGGEAEIVRDCRRRVGELGKNLSPSKCQSCRIRK
jgi:hypothetical protein